MFIFCYEEILDVIHSESVISDCTTGGRETYRVLIVFITGSKVCSWPACRLQQRVLCLLPRSIRSRSDHARQSVKYFELLKHSHQYSTSTETLHPQHTYASNDLLPTFIQYCTVLLMRRIDLLYEHAVQLIQGLGRSIIWDRHPINLKGFKMNYFHLYCKTRDI